MERPEAPAPGTLIADRYEIEVPLGQGSFGHTFRAHDRKSGRTVALKLFDPRASNDWKARELFERESTVLSALRHQGIPEVFGLERSEWQGAAATWLVMEYLEGESLAQLIEAKRPLDPTDVRHLLLELLGILDYLHTRVPPILHRDIKPANIIVRPDGAPALVDFGSVRREVTNPDESGSTVAGTYGYMPFEQYMGQASPASDLYSLGATFLHLLSGRPPKDFLTADGRVQVPATLSGDARMRAIITRLLQASPAERFASAREVRQALLAGLGTNAIAPVLRPLPTGAVTAFASQQAALFAVTTPRPLDRAAKEYLNQIAPTAWEMSTTGSKPGERPTIGVYAATIFLSIVTLGAVPIIFTALARQRRRRLTRFVRDGHPAIARVRGSRIEVSAFGQEMTKVSYEFEADGAMRRDADTVLPAVGDRWRDGDLIQVLYLPGVYDSVIVSID